MSLSLEEKKIRAIFGHAKLRYDQFAIVKKEIDCVINLVDLLYNTFDINTISKYQEFLFSNLLESEIITMWIRGEKNSSLTTKEIYEHVFQILYFEVYDTITITKKIHTILEKLLVKK